MGTDHVFEPVKATFSVSWEQIADQVPATWYFLATAYQAGPAPGLLATEGLSQTVTFLEQI